MARTLHDFGKPQLLDEVVADSRRLAIAQLSDAGRRRANNEDCVATEATLGLLVIADGVGGYRSGEVASAIAVAVIVEELHRTLASWKQNIGTGEWTPSPVMQLQSAIAKANADIFQRSQDDPKCNGMGTTVVSVLFFGQRVLVAHVGDSRLYRVRDQRLAQLTTDHSLIQELQELVASGTYSKQQVASMHAPRNLVTRALGIEPTVDVDVTEHEVKIDDLYLLCTDGLSDMVDDTSIHAVIRELQADLDETARRLIELANANGGKDNVSVILAKVLDASKPTRTKMPGLPNGF
jgi:PPM family protein phosphatase